MSKKSLPASGSRGSPSGREGESSEEPNSDPMSVGVSSSSGEVPEPMSRSRSRGSSLDAHETDYCRVPMFRAYSQALENEARVSIKFLISKFLVNRFLFNRFLFDRFLLASFMFSSLFYTPLTRSSFFSPCMRVTTSFLPVVLSRMAWRSPSG